MPDDAIRSVHLLGIVKMGIVRKSEKEFSLSDSCVDFFMSEFSLERFEASSQENGMRYWLAHNFMVDLGYETWTSFSNVINKAIASCAQLGIQIPEAFIPIDAEIDGKKTCSYKLSRFACLLVTMHADSKKPQVTKAKAALAAIADVLIQRALDENALARLEAREDLKAGEQLMTAVATSAGLENKYIGLFKDSGFRGMYNMGVKQLRKHKGLTDDKAILYDHMGLTELAGNLFRVTQTAEKIKNNNVTGMNALSQTANQVGGEVRKMMIKNSGVVPESLPLEEKITEVKKQLKQTNREMKKLDNKKKSANE